MLVADHEGRRHVQIKVVTGLNQHPWLRLPAVAREPVLSESKLRVMRTEVDPIYPRIPLFELG
ncbi:hypothetical protein BSU04_24105 [Caballeronia sordidicola]|uniref:Uncharacterized protein n=1 Tax=Caballeronia sordidicola TaxID=196367 RepID=A0A226WYR6_CABSO|nr:hypothetical protein BSU04_24105 [Caballeronia sordidicola]